MTDDGQTCKGRDEDGPAEDECDEEEEEEAVEREEDDAETEVEDDGAREVGEGNALAEPICLLSPFLTLTAS